MLSYRWPRGLTAFALALGFAMTVDAAALAAFMPPPAAPSASTVSTVVSGPSATKPQDAVTMKSWVYLKESIANIRAQVRQILAVKDDVGLMQDDLRTQEHLWHEAEAALVQENQRLSAELAALHGELSETEGAAAQAEQRKAAIERVRLDRKETDRAVAEEARQRNLEHVYFSSQRENLSAALRSEKAAMESQVSSRHEQALQLETDAVALNLRRGQLEEKVNRSGKELLLQEQRAEAESSELKRQIAGMHDGLLRIQSQVAGTQAVESQKRQLERVRADVQKEVSSMVSVQQEQTLLEAQCKQQREARTRVKCAEEGKATKRRQEAQAFCQPAKAQLDALGQMLAECRAR